MSHPKPTLLLILDGWGESLEKSANAIYLANTPTWDALYNNFPHTLISGCGEDVGLPQGQMGNSEVGHLTIGAGRVIYQDLTLISKLIENKTFFENATFLNAFETAKKNQCAIHIMGLLSDGGVHSHDSHLYALLEMAKQHEITSLFIHAFLDGRDTPPKSAQQYVDHLSKQIADTPFQIATLSGRYYAMDRDQRWERVKLAWDAIVDGQSAYHAPDALTALQAAYARNETDEFVKPTCIHKHNQATTLQDGDIVIYFNFRSDRARALSWALTQNDFKGFERSRVPHLNQLITFTEYDTNLKANVAFAPKQPQNTLGEYFQNINLKQLRIAETEKYAHVTFFFNGGIETPFQGEDRILIPSPKVATYDLKPEMSAFELTDALVQDILNHQHDFIVCNFANADMVGHTGKLDATIKAIETLDQCLAKILAALEKVGGEALITSDHGNAECMLDEMNQQPHTAHTTSLVPLIYFGSQALTFSDTKGGLADVAPTLLRIMNLKVPNEMTGKSLLHPR